MPKDISEDAANWEKNTTVGDGTSLCGAKKIFGGYGVAAAHHYFKRRFTFNRPVVKV